MPRKYLVARKGDAMSQESASWLNKMILVGQTDQFGTAWHHDKAMQGDEPNHYTGFIPLADVERRLTSKARFVEGQGTYTYVVDGATFTITDEKRKGIIRLPGSLSPDDPGAVVNVPSRNWQAHAFDDMNAKIADLLGVENADSVGIGSAGLLRNGSMYWIMLRLPEMLTVGTDKVTPFITLGTSMDGSCPTVFFRGASRSVCDNTFFAAMGTADFSARIKHTLNSADKIDALRGKLELSLTAQGDALVAECEALMSVRVTEKETDKWLDRIDGGAAGVREFSLETGKFGDEVKTGKALTFSENRRDALSLLLAKDERVSPFRDSLYGLLQASNTYQQHLKIRRGSAGETNGADMRSQRNREGMISGLLAATDVDALESFAHVRRTKLTNLLTVK